MQPRTRQTTTNLPESSDSVRSTPSLLNEGYTRLKASAAAYENACGVDSLSAIHTWMDSFGKRLDSMAETLRDEGARSRKTFEDSAAALWDEKNCENPRLLLAQAEQNQAELLSAFEQLSERLDMDADLYERITEMYEELQEALSDISDLRREYDAYWSDKGKA